MKISRRATRSKLKKAQGEYLVVGRNQGKIKKSPKEKISSSGRDTRGFFTYRRKWYEIYVFI